ncbi:hypothetical protein BC629DRAFT_1438960 [Irpex lacteus]|nr:hypothetical protein BC629DRAFT_1438960 [Irpex lacteus]
MSEGALSPTDNAPTPSRLTPMQFEWSINAPSGKDGQKTSCSFAFRDQSFNFHLRGPTTVVFTMPTPRSPRVTADIYSMDEEALKTLSTQCDDQAQVIDKREPELRAATPCESAVDQAVEDAINNAIKADAVDLSREEQAPDYPLNVDEDPEGDEKMVERKDHGEGYEDVDEENRDSSDFDYPQHQPDSDDVIVGPDDPPFLTLLTEDFEYHLRGPWLLASYQIQEWLVKVLREHDEDPLLQWGIELFWVCFIAAYPEFPHGNAWPEWNGHAIPFECEFLTNWMSRSHDPDAVPETREEMWDEVTRRVLLYFGGAL